jgi:hypothetical protein
MDMDELRTKWAEQDRKIETGLRINRHLLRVTYLDKAQSALQRLALGMGVEAMIDLPLLIWLGSFTYEHRNQMPFFLPGLGLYLFALATLLVLIRQIAFALTIDHGGPVTQMQKQVTTLRVARIRLTQAFFLTAPLLWVPLLIVALKGLLGLDAYQLFGPTYLWANVAFGVAFIPFGLWAAKTFAERLGHLPFVQGILRDLAGHSLTQASGYLETLAEFEGQS